VIVIGLSTVFALCAAIPSFAADERPAGAPSEPISLWPAVAPGDKPGMPEEKDETKHNPKAKPGTEVIRLGNVSKPTITLFRPAADKANGAAVIVCPGGGYSILAWDLEGTEVCEWLNSIGVTGVLLKYRVPGRGEQRHSASLQDAQRAIGMVRSRAKEWGIDPRRIGILGFSAGGHLAATASNTIAKRTYPAVDDADKESCRPNFTILVYPAYLDVKNDVQRLPPEVKVTADTPPAFVVMTEDDPVHVESAMAYALALKNAKIPVELHIFPDGGHGYGLRPSPHAVSHWPELAATWMKQRGLLKGR
jgi:acetyl esterase/lipase